MIRQPCVTGAAFAVRLYITNQRRRVIGFERRIRDRIKIAVRALFHAERDVQVEAEQLAACCSVSFPHRV